MTVPAVASQFNVPSTILVGGGASDQAGPIARRWGASRVLLVTDPGLVRMGVAGKMESSLRAAGLEVAVFADVQPDPTDENVRAGLTALRHAQAQAIVALGGGSALDCAKVIALLSAFPEPMRQYKGYHKFTEAAAPAKINTSQLPGLIAVPTTAGTGSEVTKVAVITDTERQEKMMMLDALLLPRAAVVDYKLTMTMPPALTAAVGVDTLTHGIEAYVSRKASGLTDPIALSCISLCAKHLQHAYAQPTHEVAREGMMLAACQGGMAFANASVCLVHGMSRPIGAVFHLPHGLSNAVLLPTVTRWSIAGDGIEAARAQHRYAAVARTMGVASPIDTEQTACAKLVDALEKLNHDLAVPRLGQCKGVPREKFDAQVGKMAEDALASGSPQNNPRVPNAAQIVALYQQAF
ncbi:MAG: iron-containing alcohol dehydrogenase [Phycisphaeraceae bacterium]|nr:iron-containing alcohol dehydrogenase [Phycisphaeraceae bacterium]